MDDSSAASAIQSWFSGNVARGQMEEQRVNTNLEKGGSGASNYKAETGLRRRKTTKMSRMSSFNGRTIDNLVFFQHAQFNASLKGIIDIQARLTEPFALVVAMEAYNEANDNDYTKYNNYIVLNVDHEKAWFSIKRNGLIVNLMELTEVVETKTSLGLEPEVITTYWLSYDRDNMTLKYGKGYAMEETTLLICDFSEGLTDADKIAKKRQTWSMFFGIYDPNRKDVTLLLYRKPSDIKKGVEKAVLGEQKAGFIHMEPIIEVRKEPLVVNPSPFVMASSKATMNLIDKNQYTFSSELPAPCRMLYETIVSSELDMEFEMGTMDVRFSDAIRYSMTTPGCLLHKTLQGKPYLRITIGPSAKESPGIPYVLEFWPPGSKSAVHNHGSVCAIIKVVFGTIQNGTFNKMPSCVYDSKQSRTVAPQELLRFDAYKGDVMWMSPEWFQTHQLRNVSNDYCATINCYRYDVDDPIQWNLFDYVNDANGQMGNFFPNTDFTFGQMRQLVLEEWANRR